MKKAFDQAITSCELLKIHIIHICIFCRIPVLLENGRSFQVRVRIAQTVSKSISLHRVQLLNANYSDHQTRSRWLFALLFVHNTRLDLNIFKHV